MKEKIGWIVIAVVIVVTIVLAGYGRIKHSMAGRIAEDNDRNLQTLKQRKIPTVAHVAKVKQYRQDLDAETNKLIEAMKKNFIFPIMKGRKYVTNFGSDWLKQNFTKENPNYENFFNDLILQPVETYNKLARETCANFFKVNGLPPDFSFLAIPRPADDNGGWIPVNAGDISAAMGNIDHRRNMYILIHLYRIFREARVEVEIPLLERYGEDAEKGEPDHIKFEEIQEENGRPRTSKEVFGFPTVSRTEMMKIPRYVRAIMHVEFFGSNPDDGTFPSFELKNVYSREQSQFKEEVKSLIPADLKPTPFNPSADAPIAPNVANLANPEMKESYPGERLLYTTFIQGAGTKLAKEEQIKEFTEGYMYRTSGVLFRIMVDPEVVGVILDKLEGSGTVFEKSYSGRQAAGVDWIKDGKLRLVPPKQQPPLPFFGEIVSLDIVRAANMGFTQGDWKKYIDNIKNRKLDALKPVSRMNMPGPVILQVEMRFYWLNSPPYSEEDKLAGFAKWPTD